MRALAAAIAFLTTLPVPARCLGDKLASPATMLLWWAPVGALIGCLAAGITWAAALVLPWVTCAALGVVALVALSGGLHLEGLMDTSDGLGSRAPREKALEIMKDSRAGAFGVIAAACVLLLKFGLLAGMAPQTGIVALALAPMLARVMQVVVMTAHPYARPEGGMGGAFFAAARIGHCVLGLLLCAVAATAADALIAGVHANLAALGAVLVVGAWSVLPARRLGGHTGDTIGATSELTELALFLALALLAHP